MEKFGIGSSLYKFSSLNTVHFAIFDDVKSPYHALEAIFTIYPTKIDSSDLFSENSGKVSWPFYGFPRENVRVAHSTVHGGPCYGPTSKRTTRVGTGFQQVEHGFISIWSYSKN